MLPESIYHQRAKEWLDRARSNLIRSRVPKQDGVFWEDHCFDLQQAVEKSIKAVLVAYDVEFPRTHHIELLISIVKDHGIFWQESLDQAAGLTMYAVQARYPGLSLQVTEEHYLLALSIAERILAWAEESIK